MDSYKNIQFGSMSKPESVLLDDQTWRRRGRTRIRIKLFRIHNTAKNWLFGGQCGVQSDTSKANQDHWHLHHPGLPIQYDCQQGGNQIFVPDVRVGKNPGLKKKPAQWVFLGFFWVFCFFLGFFGFFCPEERVFRVFFSFTNTFGCIQTLNYNHSC